MVFGSPHPHSVVLTVGHRPAKQFHLAVKQAHRTSDFCRVTSRLARLYSADADEMGCRWFIRLLVIGDHFLNTGSTHNPGRDLQCAASSDAQLGVVVAAPEGRRGTRATTGRRLHNESPGWLIARESKWATAYAPTARTTKSFRRRAEFAGGSGSRLRIGSTRRTASLSHTPQRCGRELEIVSQFSQ